MKCGECMRGRRFAHGSVYCVLYGVIISVGHECGLKGGRKRDVTVQGLRGPERRVPWKVRTIQGLRRGKRKAAGLASPDERKPKGVKSFLEEWQGVGLSATGNKQAAPDPAAG